MVNNINTNKQHLIAFHLAFPVNDIETTRYFYKNIIGCEIGREAESWIDFNFYSHQISAHVKPEETREVDTNAIDGENVPARHFGLVLDWETWHELVERLKNKKIQFLIEPTIRFKGLAGEQATFFILDPSDNALEFKSFKKPEQLFARDKN